MHLCLIKSQIALDFENAPTHLFVNGLEAKALLTVVGNRRDCVIREEFLHDIDEHGLARSGTSDNERNHLPGIQFIDLKEESPEHHLDGTNDLVTLINREMRHLIFNDLLEMRRRNVLPVFFLENAFVKLVTFVKLDCNDVGRNVLVALAKEELSRFAEALLETILKSKPVAIGMQILKFDFLGIAELLDSAFGIMTGRHIAPHFKHRLLGCNGIDEIFNVTDSSLGMRSLAFHARPHGRTLNFLLAAVCVAHVALGRNVF